ncbi:MAG: hypothetical protein LUC88_01145 [Prevotella sp.]|nr:hypothetical protein [Prevotella sp.]
MRRNNKILTAVVLLFWTASASAQTTVQKYVSVNEDLVKKIVEETLPKSGMVDDVQRGWAENLMSKAFESYFSSKETQVNVHGQYEIDELNGKIKELKDTINNRDKEIKDLQKKVSKENLDEKQSTIDDLNKTIGELNATIDTLNETINKSKNEISELSAGQEKWEQDLHAKDDTISSLKKEMDTLAQDKDRLSEENSKLQNNATIADNVTKQYSEKQNALNRKYTDCYNASIEKITDIQGIQNAISEYSEYSKIIGVEIPDEDKKNIDYLNVVCKASEIYQSAVSILDKKYDAAVVKDWLQQYNANSKGFSSLKDMQQTVMAQIKNAMETIESATNNFKKSVLPYLKEQGQIPNNQTADEVKKMVSLNVQIYAESRYKDTTKYNEYHTNLNRVLQNTLDGLKVMDEEQYKAFLEKIEDEL